MCIRDRIHIDHNDKITEYTVDYLKNDVERMLKHYKKLLKHGGDGGTPKKCGGYRRSG